MKRLYFDALLEDAKAIVMEIEKYCGAEIEIEITRPEQADKKSLACNVEGRSPKIILPNKDYFPDSAVVHELIHIRRLRVEGVPSLTVSEDKWSKECELGFLAIDNDLEHLCVIQEEISLRPERRKRWEENFSEKLGSGVLEKIDKENKRNVLVRMFLIANLALKSENLANKIRSLIDSDHIKDNLETFCTEIESKINSKEDICRSAVDFMGLKKYSPCLKYRNSDGSIYYSNL